MGRTRAYDGAGLAGLSEVYVRVGGGEDRVGRADDGTDLRHDCWSGWM